MFVRKSDISDLEKLARLSDFVGLTYSDNPKRYLDIMTEIIVGVSFGPINTSKCSP